MKKIKLILTGGTIGSQLDQGALHVALKSPILELYHRYNHQLAVDFDVAAPLSLLSENMDFKAWETLYREILKGEGYDGILITHGTDTLPFSTLAQSFLVQNPSVPIVFVASNKPLADETGNGFSNFCQGVRFIVEQGLKGVFTIYRNTDGQSMVHLGTRLKPSQPFSGDFDSVLPFGKMTDEGFIPLQNPKLPLTPYPLKPVFSGRILPLRAMPNFNYDLIDLSVKPQAILHDLYHSGTACVQGEQTSLLNFARTCERAGIPLFCAPARDGPYYETTMALLKTGAHLLTHMTYEACYVKLALALAQMPLSQVFAFMQETNLAHERLS